MTAFDHYQSILEEFHKCSARNFIIKIIEIMECEEKKAVIYTYTYTYVTADEKCLYLQRRSKCSTFLQAIKISSFLQHFTFAFNSRRQSISLFHFVLPVQT